MYTIHMPGKLYRALLLLEVFAPGSCVDDEMCAAFQSATETPWGRGTRRTLTGPAAALRAVLAEILKVVEEADNRVAPAYELGVEYEDLRRVAR